MSRPKRTAARKDWSWLSSHKTEEPGDEGERKTENTTAVSSGSNTKRRAGRPPKHAHAIEAPANAPARPAMAQSIATDAVDDSKRRRKRKTFDDDYETSSTAVRSDAEKESDGDYKKSRRGHKNKKHKKSNKKERSTTPLDSPSDNDPGEPSSKYSLNASGFVIGDEADDTFSESSNTDVVTEKRRSKRHDRSKKKKKHKKHSKHRYSDGDEYVTENSKHKQSRKASLTPEKNENADLLPKLTIKISQPVSRKKNATGSTVTPTDSAPVLSSPTAGPPVASSDTLHDAAVNRKRAPPLPVKQLGSASNSLKKSRAPASPGKRGAGASTSTENLWQNDTMLDDDDDGDVITDDAVQRNDDSEEEWLEAVEEGDLEKLEQLKKQIVQKSILTPRQRAVQAAAAAGHDEGIAADPLTASDSFASVLGDSGVPATGTASTSKKKTAEKRAVELKKRRDQALTDREKLKRGTLSRLLDSSTSEAKAAAAFGNVAVDDNDANAANGALVEKLPPDVKPWQLSSYEYVISGMRGGNGGLLSFYKVPIGAPSPFGSWKPISPKEIPLCEVCRKQPKKYRCPKTRKLYCSLECYSKLGAVLNADVGLAQISSQAVKAEA